MAFKKKVSKPAKVKPAKSKPAQKSKKAPEAEPIHLKALPGRIIGRMKVNAVNVDSRPDYEIVTLTGRSESNALNNTFSTDTPIVNLTFQITKPGSRGRLKQGRDYYLDLVEAT